MLRYLRINHLAVIDAVEVEFGPGLNVLTGETGAGKSILVGAVDLLLGGRASADLVRTGEDHASIEAIFEVAGSRGGEEVLVRREISAQGRSRAFINDTLATAGALKDLARRLVELHGQHEHHTLLDAATHLAVIDTFANLAPDADRVRARFEAWQSAAADLDRLRRMLSDREVRLDLVGFQVAELDRAAAKPHEDEELAAARQVLVNAERVERLCEESYAALYESDGAILAALGSVWKRVGELAALDPIFQPHLDAREGIKSQLEDLALQLRRYADAIEPSPARLQAVEERLAVLERLKRKHGPSLDAVLKKQEALRQELADLREGDERLAEFTQAYTASRDAYLAAATALSERRREAASRFSRALERLVADLAMEHTRFEVRFAPEPLPEEAWTAGGIDAAEFFVSANPGEDMRPLARIASGGELSRIMLAVKTLTAASRHGFTSDIGRPASGAAPGLIFDEIDAGIGGRVAGIVGRKLHALGSAFQVLCITHLPQIAALADAHYRIEKRVHGRRTHTTVRRLDEAGRIDEVARMLGGDRVTEAARASARELMRGGESNTKGESERAKAKHRKK